MLKFVTDARLDLAKRESQDRVKDFAEITEGFSQPQLKLQAERCAQCGVPFCQSGCPLHNNIPDWLRLAAEGRPREAYEMSAATNNMPEICGRICPQDRLCEKACVLEQSHFGAVTIGAVEKELADLAWKESWVAPVAIDAERPTSVGIIGAGPAGLAAAEELRKAGHQVHVYDRHDRAGGLLTYGIPNFKLDKEVVLRRVRRLSEAGVHFHQSVHIGRDVRFADMRARHSAVLIATGVYRAREMSASSSYPNAVQALEFLIASNRRGFGDAVDISADIRYNAEGKKVVVIGGGDTAMDCVRTAVRQGASRVTCLYRRDRENMPGSRREVQYAEEEGVQFEWLSSPTGFVERDGLIRGVRVVKNRLGHPDESGRRSAQKIEGSEHVVDADLVIFALGFEPEDVPVLFECPELKVSATGTLAVDRELQTSVPGVFAAGDIVRGASLVVWAIRQGREAAANMHKFITEKK